MKSRVFRAIIFLFSVSVAFPAGSAAEKLSIESVKVERPELCAGRSTFITIKGVESHPGDYQYMIRFLDPRLRVPVFTFGRYVRWTAPETPGRYPIFIIMEDLQGRRAEKLISIKVKSCATTVPSDWWYDAPITAKLGEQYNYTFDISPSLSAHLSNLGEIANIKWDFGDGKTAKSREPRISHSYNLTSDRLYNYFLITATVHLKKGQSGRVKDVEGHTLPLSFSLRRGVSIYSKETANKKAGYLVLHPQVTCLQRNKKGVDYQISLSNPSVIAALLVSIQQRIIDAQGNEVGRNSRPVLKLIPARGSLTIDVPDIPTDISRIECEAQGTAQDGRQLGGLWQLRPVDCHPESSGKGSP